MFGISGFFKNIQNAFTKEVILRTAIKESVKKFTGADIPIQNIVYKNGTVTLKGLGPSALSVIFIKKRKIIDDLNSSQKQNINDIR